jgi:hypothetical protein
MNDITSLDANGARTASRTVTPTRLSAVGVSADEPDGADGSRRAARSSVGEVANTSRIVSLNCRTLPNPAAKARRVGALRSSDSERAGTEFVGEHPVQVPFAVAEPPRDTADTLTFDDTVGDQPHRPGDDVLADVPFGRAR